MKKYTINLMSVFTTGATTHTLEYIEQMADEKIIHTATRKIVQPIIICALVMKVTRLSLTGKYRNSVKSRAKNIYSESRYV